MLSRGANRRRRLLGRGHLSPSVRRKCFETSAVVLGLVFTAELISLAERDVHVLCCSTWMLLYTAVVNTCTFQELHAFMFSKEGN